MLLMGDEVRHTQNGNNNAYCLNDDTTWFDWDLLVRHGDVQTGSRKSSSRFASGGPCRSNDST